MSTRHTILIIIALILNAVLVALTYLDYKDSAALRAQSSRIEGKIDSVEEKTDTMADFILNLELYDLPQ